MDQEKVVESLNEIMELELAGVVRYSHYALMVFGHNRIPICGWLRNQAQESLNHANSAGEFVTSLGGHPSLKIGELLETHKHTINDILEESLEHEKKAVSAYGNLLELVTGKSLALEEFARKMIFEEETHIFEVEKMLRQPI